jgi:uncharacterized RDD family membrane protein YckC
MDNLRVYAGFWRRFLALFVDISIIIVTVTVFSVIVLSFMEQFTNIDVNSYDVISRIMFTYPIMMWLYYSLMESSSLQGTIGKLLLKIKVTDYNGDKISFTRATGRFFSKIISAIGYLGFIAVAFTKRKQGFHDLISGCLVILK